MSTLVRLYPRAWRDRYEAEFMGMLESRPPRTRDRLDIVRGALDARLHPEVPGTPDRPRPAMQPARLAAAAAVIAGVAWLAWVGLVLRDFRGWGTGQPESATLMAALAALMSLALAAAHVFLLLAGQATIRPFGGVAASIAAVSFTLTAFGGGTILVFALLGSIALAMAMAGRSLPALVAAIWVATSAVVLVVMLGFVGGGGQDVDSLWLIAPFGPSWILVGMTLGWRGVPSPTPAAPASAPDLTGQASAAAGSAAKTGFRHRSRVQESFEVAHGHAALQRELPDGPA